MHQPDQQQQPRRRRRWWLVPFTFVGLFFGAIMVAALALIFSAVRTPAISRGSVLELHLTGGLSEAPSPLSDVLPGLAGPPSLYELRDAILAAADDDNIVALKLDIEQTECGWAQMQELLAAFDTFRQHKPIHVFLRGDIVSDIDYALSLGATKIWLAPQSTLFVNGLRAEVEFWRGTLDKLHVVPQFFMMKEYKGAGEVNSRHHMSEFFREATTELVQDLWQTSLDLIATRRKLEPDKVRTATEQGLLTAEQACAAGLVDTLGFEEDVRAELQALAATATYTAVGVRRYLDHRGPVVPDLTARRIAVVFGEGPIFATSRQDLFSEAFHGPRVAAAIRRAADDDAMAAILFRVNSPGGSPVGSDHVWRAIEYARTVRHKPVIVSFSSVAASGGYWVSMGADAIVAQPSTITGSIGVVFGKFDVSGLYQLVGANVDSVQTTDNADLLSLVTTFTPAQTATVNGWLESTYEGFKTKVATGRKLTAEAVERVARGRVWSGTDALDHGLVDVLGGYNEAIALAKDRANIGADERVQLVPYPAPVGLIEALFSDDSASILSGVARNHVPFAQLWHGDEPARAFESILLDLARPRVWLLAPSLRIF